MEVLGLCNSCRKPVYRRFKHTLLGKLPQFAFVEGKGIYHQSCWRDDKKAMISKKTTTYETPATALGKISRSKEHY